MNKKTRADRLMPNGVPRYVRCYDNGGESVDRVTVVYTGRYKGRGLYTRYVGMSEHPFHPQGFGVHGESRWPIDVTGSAWGGPSIGKRCHLGLRIPFDKLPPDCQRLVLQDYREMWNLPE